MYGHACMQMAITAIRELKALQKLKHKNIVSFKEVVTEGTSVPCAVFPIPLFPPVCLAIASMHAFMHRPSFLSPRSPNINTEGRREIPREIYLVLEYCESDLSGIVRTCPLTPQHVRSYTYQILRGLAYIQRNGLLHRDLKSACCDQRCFALPLHATHACTTDRPRTDGRHERRSLTPNLPLCPNMLPAANILVTRDHLVKIADWGLCRWEPPKKQARLTNPVVTLWYRAPELLLGTARYGRAVDMWSVGAILVELLTGKPFIEGRDEVDQLHRIFDMCGTPEYEGHYTGPRFARRSPRLLEELRKR